VAGLIKPLESMRPAPTEDLAPPPIPGSNYATKNNPGGLRNSKRAFRYKTVEEGVRAMDALLAEKYFSKQAYDTIEEYAGKYVGPVGRETIERYKRNISKWSGVPRDMVIRLNDRKTRNAILAAALRQESGGNWRRYVNELFSASDDLAEFDVR